MPALLLRGGLQTKIHSSIFGARSTLALRSKSLDRLKSAKNKFYSKNAALKKVRDRKVCFTISRRMGMLNGALTFFHVCCMLDL